MSDTERPERPEHAIAAKYGFDNTPDAADVFRAEIKAAEERLRKVDDSFAQNMRKQRLETEQARHNSTAPPVDLASELDEVINEPAANTAGNSGEAKLIEFETNFEFRKLKARELAKQRYIQESTAGVHLPDFIRLDEFLAQPDDEDPYLIEEIWPKGGHILIVAQQKAGKTTLRNNLVKSLVDGYDFLNRFEVTPTAGKIVILDLQLPKNMLRRWMRDVGINNTPQLVVVPMRGQGASLNLGIPEVRAKWAQKFKDWNASAVILDCLRPVLDALRLSEDKDASKFLGDFDALLNEAQVDDAAVIHHAGHGSDRARGDSGILGWSDATWGLSLEDPNNQGSPRYFKAYGRIERDIPDSKLDYDPLTRKLTWVGGTKTDAKAKDARAHVVAFLRNTPVDDDHPAPSQTAIQKVLKAELDITFPASKKAIAMLKDEGVVVVVEGKAGTASAHSLTESAAEKYPPPATNTKQPIHRFGTDSAPLEIGQTQDRFTDLPVLVPESVNRSTESAVNGPDQSTSEPQSPASVGKPAKRTPRPKTPRRDKP
jgi:hypothetical protein